MTSDGPDPTDPIWQVPPTTNLPTPMIGSTVDHLEDRRRATSLEGWSEVPLPKKMQADIANRILSTLVDANIKVRRIEFRRAGIFNRGMMRVRLAVPEDSLSHAISIAQGIHSRK